MKDTEQNNKKKTKAEFFPSKYLNTKIKLSNLTKTFITASTVDT